MDEKAINEWAEIFAIFEEIAKAQAEERDREDRMIDDMIENQIDSILLGE
tara:strand:+ start:143 stop:292 length:150 start_codon:yes stop_codon:yes gene_type:complete